MLTLVTGGARSGKSRHAQALCRHSSSVIYIATARPSDEEMISRIARHRNDRPAEWRTVEAPLELAAAVRSHSQSPHVILVDCITVWLSNVCWEHHDCAFDEISDCASRELELVIACAKHSDLVIVTNEVGSGIVPELEIARRFRDLQGFCNQALAAAADWVYLVVAGIPVPIKSLGPSGVPLPLNK